MGRPPSLRGARLLEETLSFDVETGSNVGNTVILFAIIGFMVCLSALFSGLTLGLLGLDKTGLQIVIGGGSESEKAWARAVMTVRADGNRLLCTLLLGNVAVNSLLSITLSALGGGLTGFLVSTALIVVLGEIMPQATCSRHALRIGYLTLPITKVFLLVLAPVAVPLGKMLDFVLGEDVGTVHSRGEILQYMDVHLKAGEIEADSSKVMHGALEMKSTVVEDVMTPLSDVYMLPESTTLSFRVIREIFEHGFSRVPVYRGSRQNVVGLLFVKDLIFVDPEDGTPLSEMMSIFSRTLHVVNGTDTLDDVLKVFKRGQGHLSLVCETRPYDANFVKEQEEKEEKEELPAELLIPLSPTTTADVTAAQSEDDELTLGDSAKEDDEYFSEDEDDEEDDRPSLHRTNSEIKRRRKKLSPAMSAALEVGIEMRSPRLKLYTKTPSTLVGAANIPRGERTIVGIVTLEDIIEEIIGDEIIDETDVYVDNDHQIKVAGRCRFDMTKLRRLDAEYVDEKLSSAEVDAITAHLLTNVTQLREGKSNLSAEKMRQLVRSSRVVERKKRTASSEEEVIDPNDYIYEMGESASFATLILSGKLGVVAGRQGFRSEVGPWTVLGADSLVLEEGSFVPDFSSYVLSDTVRCVFVSRLEYNRASSRRSLSRHEMVERRRKLAARRAGQPLNEINEANDDDTALRAQRSRITFREDSNRDSEATPETTARTFGDKRHPRMRASSADSHEGSHEGAATD